MKHARPDYNRIQDPHNIIPEDEPVFLIRGKDKVAPFAVDAWADIAEAAGARPNIVNAARRQAQAMRDWQAEHGNQTPDMEGV
jgi:hypothetical protein